MKTIVLEVCLLPEIPWEERPGAPPVFDPGRDALTQRVASLLPAAEPETPAASPGAVRQPETPAAWPGE